MLHKMRCEVQLNEKVCCVCINFYEHFFSFAVQIHVKFISFAVLLNILLSINKSISFISLFSLLEKIIIFACIMHGTASSVQNNYYKFCSSLIALKVINSIAYVRLGTRSAFICVSITVHKRKWNHSTVGQLVQLFRIERTT